MSKYHNPTTTRGLDGLADLAKTILKYLPVVLSISPVSTPGAVRTPWINSLALVVDRDDVIGA